MSTEQLAQALRNMLDITKDSEGVAGYRSDGKISDWRDFYEVDEAWDALAAHEAEKAQAAAVADALAHAVDALEEIALAGMSVSGQESEEVLRDWHARRAFQFIGIAALAREKVREITSPANTGPAT